MTTRGYREPRPCKVRVPEPDKITGELKERECRKPIPGGHPCCTEHWRTVGAGLRTALTEAWKHFDLTGSGWKHYEDTRTLVMDAAERGAWREYGGRPADD